MPTQEQTQDFFARDVEKTAENRPACVSVLTPFPVSRAYDYEVVGDMTLQPGDYVQVPLGRRETPAVVWDGAAANDVDPKKLKPVLRRYDAPPMTASMRAFIDRVARYTMSDTGMVLKMALPVPAALEPEAPATGYLAPESVPEKDVTPKRRAVLDVLSDGVPRRAAELAREAGCSAGVITGMADKGLLHGVEMTTPPPCRAPDTGETPLKLSAKQAEAAGELKEHVKKAEFAGILLDGVTGAGKTEVYFEAVAEALRMGKQVLVLLPEIALSAQFLERFERRFGTQPAVWHSEVSEGRKRVTWRGVASGETKVVVGARSALFLPFADLGLIIVDEEHDGSYKQEDGVIYHARDMAVLRAQLESAPVLLVSATPSLETMTNVEQGKYDAVFLPSRHGGAQLPDMHVIDMRVDRPDRQCFISPPLRKALAETVAEGGQAMLFLNRRGYAPLTLCRNCGYRFQCPHCTAWLVEHRRNHRLHCHHCGYSHALPPKCPECEEEASFAACGPGVERIAEELHAFMPDARAMVLASDTASSPEAIRAAIRRIEDHEVDIVIGTQIVAKGHHFPRLTCVGIIDADLGLTGGDLRAAERTWQLLHQVSGRAGRGQAPGHVYLQTFMPEHRVLKALAGGEKDRFLSVEALERQEAGMPPFGRLAALIVSGPDAAKVDELCAKLARSAPLYEGVHILGPAEAPMAILRGRHRRRFLVKAPRGVAIQKLVQSWVDGVKVPSRLRIQVDIDPQSFY